MPRLPISRTRSRFRKQLGDIQSLAEFDQRNWPSAPHRHDEIIKPPRSYGITTCVNHNCGFNKINRTRRQLIASDIARAQDIAPGSSRKIAAMAGYRNRFGSPRSS